MEELIKKFMEIKGKEIINQAKKIKEKYNNKSIRIMTSGSSSQTYDNQSYYYYDPILKEINEGTSFMSGNNSNYSYKQIGDIEICITQNLGYEDYDYINIERIIRPEDENLEYADDHEKCEFPSDEFVGIDFYELCDIRSNYPGTVIAECVNCNKQYIPHQEDIESGVYTELNEEMTKVICSECTNDMISIKEFLKSIEDENKKEKYRYYLIDYISLNEEDKLFLQ